MNRDGERTQGDRTCGEGDQDICTSSPEWIVHFIHITCPLMVSLVCGQERTENLANNSGASYVPCQRGAVEGAPSRDALLC